MQITGMLYGSKLLQFAGFPASEVLGPDASDRRERYGEAGCVEGASGHGRPSTPHS